MTSSRSLRFTQTLALRHDNGWRSALETEAEHYKEEIKTLFGDTEPDTDDIKAAKLSYPELAYLMSRVHQLFPPKQASRVIDRHAPQVFLAVARDIMYCLLGVDGCDLHAVIRQRNYEQQVFARMLAGEDVLLPVEAARAYTFAKGIFGSFILGHLVFPFLRCCSAFGYDDLSLNFLLAGCRYDGKDFMGFMIKQLKKEGAAPSDDMLRRYVQLSDDFGVATTADIEGLFDAQMKAHPSPKPQNAYEILGVSQEAKQRDIKKAFLKKAKELHPDKATGNAASFIVVSQAYQQIESREKRDTYDKELQNADKPAWLFSADLLSSVFGVPRVATDEISQRRMFRQTIGNAARFATDILHSGITPLFAVTKGVASGFARLGNLWNSRADNNVTAPARRRTDATPTPTAGKSGKTSNVAPRMPAQPEPIMGKSKTSTRAHASKKTTRAVPRTQPEPTEARLEPSTRTGASKETKRPVPRTVAPQRSTTASSKETTRIQIPASQAAATQRTPEANNTSNTSFHERLSRFSVREPEQRTERGNDQKSVVQYSNRYPTLPSRVGSPPSNRSAVPESSSGQGVRNVRRSLTQQSQGIPFGQAAQYEQPNAPENRSATVHGVRNVRRPLTQQSQGISFGQAAQYEQPNAPENRSTAQNAREPPQSRRSLDRDISTKRNQRQPVQQQQQQGFERRQAPIPSPESSVTLPATHEVNNGDALDFKHSHPSTNQSSPTIDPNLLSSRTRHPQPSSTPSSSQTELTREETTWRRFRKEDAAREQQRQEQPVQPTAQGLSPEETEWTRRPQTISTPSPPQADVTSMETKWTQFLQERAAREQQRQEQTVQPTAQGLPLEETEWTRVRREHAATAQQRQEQPVQPPAQGLSPEQLRQQRLKMFDKPKEPQIQSQPELPQPEAADVASASRALAQNVDEPATIAASEDITDESESASREDALSDRGTNVSPVSNLSDNNQPEEPSSLPTADTTKRVRSSSPTLDTNQVPPAFQPPLASLASFPSGPQSSSAFSFTGLAGAAPQQHSWPALVSGTSLSSVPSRSSALSSTGLPPWSPWADVSSNANSVPQPALPSGTSLPSVQAPSSALNSTDIREPAPQQPLADEPEQKASPDSSRPASTSGAAAPFESVLGARSVAPQSVFPESTRSATQQSLSSPSGNNDLPSAIPAASSTLPEFKWDPSLPWGRKSNAESALGSSASASTAPSVQPAAGSLLQPPSALSEITVHVASSVSATDSSLFQSKPASSAFSLPPEEGASEVTVEVEKDHQPAKRRSSESP